MLSCTSSNKFTREKNQKVPQNLCNQKMDGLWNRVEHPTVCLALSSNHFAFATASEANIIDLSHVSCSAL